MLTLENLGLIVFFTGAQKKNFYTLQPMESNFKYSSIQMMHSIELKFGMYIIGIYRYVYFTVLHIVRNLLNLGLIVFFTGVQKRTLTQYRLCSQITRSMLVSK